MALLVLSRGIDPAPFVDHLRRLAPGRDIRVWPDTGDDAAIEYALVWRPPAGELATFSGLKAVFSIGAGVDHLIGDAALPDAPIVRFVDPSLTLRMREYVLLHVLLHQRRMLDYADLQRERVWREIDQPAADAVRVGVMGLGVLGTACARALSEIGFQVAGWSRTEKTIDGVACHAGGDGLRAFLARTDILVCLLPLTPDTKGILSASLFARLARDGVLPGPVLINAGRGGLQVEADILAALDSGVLSGCSLDVFEQEPLPSRSPLWRHPRVVITPHTASVSDPGAVCRHVLAQIARAEAGDAYENVVDRGLGY